MFDHAGDAARCLGDPHAEACGEGLQACPGLLAVEREPTAQEAIAVLRSSASAEVPSLSEASSTDSITPREKSSGVEGALAVTIRPSGSITTRSVKVPPVSIPQMNLVTGDIEPTIQEHPPAWQEGGARAVFPPGLPALCARQRDADEEREGGTQAGQAHRQAVSTGGIENRTGQPGRQEASNAPCSDQAPQHTAVIDDAIVEAKRRRVRSRDQPVAETAAAANAK